MTGDLARKTALELAESRWWDEWVAYGVRFIERNRREADNAKRAWPPGHKLDAKLAELREIDRIARAALRVLVFNDD